MTDETGFCTNPDCQHATIGHFAPRGCMMPGCQCKRTYGNEDAPGGTEAAAPAPVSDAVTQTVKVPFGFVLYQCKIGPGKFVCLPLPPSMSFDEANRISRFVLTQADDEGPMRTLIEQAKRDIVAAIERNKDPEALAAIAECASVPEQPELEPSKVESSDA
jgi:hypothetical protein